MEDPRLIAYRNHLRFQQALDRALPWRVAEVTMTPYWYLRRLAKEYVSLNSVVKVLPSLGDPLSARVASRFVFDAPTTKQ